MTGRGCARNGCRARDNQEPTSYTPKGAVAQTGRADAGEVHAHVLTAPPHCLSCDRGIAAFGTKHELWMAVALPRSLDLWASDPVHSISTGVRRGVPLLDYGQVPGPRLTVVFLNLKPCIQACLRKGGGAFEQIMGQEQSTRVCAWCCTKKSSLSECNVCHLQYCSIVFNPKAPEEASPSQSCWWCPFSFRWALDLGRSYDCGRYGPIWRPKASACAVFSLEKERDV